MRPLRHCLNPSSPIREIVAALLLAMMIVLIAGQSVAGDLSLWRQIQSVTTNEREAQRVATETFSYLHQEGMSPTPMIEGFTSKELDHMVDVRWTFRILESVLFGGMWIFIGLLLCSPHKSTVFLWGSCLSLCFLLSLLVIPFDVLFVWFHHVFFVPGSWTFDGGLMVSSFTEPFFAWLAQIWWMRAFTAGLALAMISFISARTSNTTTLI